jgi:putative intracellular protease/amidase
MPGNLLNPAVPPAFTEFVQTRFADPKVRFLTICTGSIVLTPTGILNHLRVASNKKGLKYLVQSGQLDHNVHWVGEGWEGVERSLDNDIDLAAEFARVYFDMDVVEEAKEISEEAPKPDTPDPCAWILTGIDLGYGDHHPHTK